MADISTAIDDDCGTVQEFLQRLLESNATNLLRRFVSVDPTSSGYDADSTAMLLNPKVTDMVNTIMRVNATLGITTALEDDKDDDDTTVLTLLTKLHRAKFL